jgi:hypothetical protein
MAGVAAVSGEPEKGCAMSTTGVGPLGCEAKGSVIDSGTLARISTALPRPFGAIAVVPRMVPKAVSAGRERCAGAIAEFQARYGEILKAGAIDIDANLREAAAMSQGQLHQAVKDIQKWDYKNNPVIIKKVPDQLLRDEFGNVHFGILSAGRGLGLYFATLGAGFHQLFVQGGGDTLGFAVGALAMDPFSFASSMAATFDSSYGYTSHAVSSMTLSNAKARLLIRLFGMGDNPGDAAAIQRGWEYFFLRQGYEPPF